MSKIIDLEKAVEMVCSWCADPCCITTIDGKARYCAIVGDLYMYAEDALHGVLIEGMTLPRTCGECPFFNGGDCFVCCHPPCKKNRRAAWCPLKEA